MKGDMKVIEPQIYVNFRFFMDEQNTNQTNTGADAQPAAPQQFKEDQEAVDRG